jgi:hypothetical protein
VVPPAPLIHRSAWNIDSRKLISEILYSPAPIPRNALPTGPPHSPAPIPLVTRMDRYARLRMLPCCKQILVVAVIPEGRAILAHTLRGSGGGGAGLLSEDPAPSAYVLGMWLRRDRRCPSFRLCACPSNTTREDRRPRGVKGLRSHSHASRRAIYARSCKWTSENPPSTHSGA